MQNLYHYTKFESALKIIGLRQFKTSDPEKLNDPFECSPKIKKLDEYTEKDLQYFFTEHERLKTDLYQRTYSHWEEVGCPIPFKEFFRLINLSNLNYRESLRKFFRFISGSMKHDIIPMWTHYGEDHKGVVFEFDFDKMPFSGMKKAKKSVVKVEYIDTRPTYCHFSNGLHDIEEAREIFSKIVRTKHTSWENEQEVKFIFSINLDSDPQTEEFFFKDIDDTLYLKILPESIKTIYCGARMCDTHYEVVKKAVKKWLGDVPVKKMIQCKENFALLST